MSEAPEAPRSNRGPGGGPSPGAAEDDVLGAPGATRPGSAEGSRAGSATGAGGDPAGGPDHGTAGSGRRRPWYAEGLRFSCTACGNCCKNHGEYAYVYLMEPEVRAIAAHLGLDVETFRARDCTVEEGWTVLATADPACRFLTEEGKCAIYPVRPVQCRTWPFWEHTLERRVWEGEVRAICPGAGHGTLHSAREVEAIAAATEDWYEGRLDAWPGREPRSGAAGETGETGGYGEAGEASDACEAGEPGGAPPAPQRPR